MQHRGATSTCPGQLIAKNNKFKHTNSQFKAYVSTQELTMAVLNEFLTSKSHTAEGMENKFKVGL